MQTLRELIQAFQREITAALVPPEETGQGMAWKAERVTLSLDMVLDESGVPRVRMANEKEAESGHRLRIEFLVGPSSPAGAEKPARSGMPIEHEGEAIFTAGPESDIDRAYEDLTALLGAPGFNSSARAAVFCEALQKLSLPQAFALCGALTSPAGEVDDEAIRRARHQLLGIIRSGSLKSPERAAEIMTRVFEQWPLPSLVRFVTEKWKTEDNWAE